MSPVYLLFLDEDECKEEIDVCGNNAVCTNTIGGYYCQCETGYQNNKRKLYFTAEDELQCKDINECTENKTICGPNAECNNTVGSYFCVCAEGFVASNKQERFNGSQNVTCNEQSSSARGASSFCPGPSSIHSQPWDHRSHPPDPWDAPQTTPSPVPSNQTWLSAAAPAATGIDPFSPLASDKKGSAVPIKGSLPRHGSPTDGDFFDDAMDGGQVNVNGRGEGSPELFDLSRLGECLAEPVPPTCSAPEAFLGPAAASLVNLDSLIPPNPTPKNLNPFLTGLSEPSVTNPFQSEPTRLTLNQMRPGSASPDPSSLQNSTSLPMPVGSQPLSLPSSFTQPSEGQPNMSQPLPPTSSTSTHGQPDQSQNPFL
ncbi:epsin-3-like [Silurus meridionalis]|uniref:epsin-3-like n=1 Tax=Silurus meridionalis TaxID=175797 RepID=UPI001EEBBC71|nr:epsin-3-like [Silurus meridionalis]